MSPPDEDPLVPVLPLGYPIANKPCLWIPPTRVGTPKRDRDGAGSSADEEMRDPEAKWRTSATDKEDCSMLAPSDVNVP